MPELNAQTVKDYLKKGMAAMTGLGDGDKNGRKGSPETPRKIRPDINPFTILFRQFGIFQAIFDDPELSFVDPFATIMFFFASIMLIVSVPYSITRCPLFVGLRKYGNKGTLCLWFLDCFLRATTVFASLFTVWVPFNRAVFACFGKDKATDPLKDYLKDPDNFETVVTNDLHCLSMGSYCFAGALMFAGMLAFCKFIQRNVEDTPREVVLAARKAHIEANKKGSGDQREEDDAVRRTPLRKCRLRTTVGQAADSQE